MLIRKSQEDERKIIFEVEKVAFGEDEVAVLADELMEDKTAFPLVSLLAFEGDQPIGHILFTKAAISTNESLSTYILAPLAVIPEYQRKGIGGCLIEEGLKILKDMTVDLVFVLGHPEYYPRHGFNPAGQLGFSAPYPIPDKNADAWMVQALRPDIIGNCKGQVICSEKLDRPEHWRE